MPGEATQTLVWPGEANPDLGMVHALTLATFLLAEGLETRLKPN